MFARILTLRADAVLLLKRAWSVRFMAAAIFLSALEVGFAVLSNDPPIPRGIFAGLSAVTSGLAFYARFVAQKGITPESNGDEQ